MLYYTNQGLKKFMNKICARAGFKKYLKNFKDDASALLNPNIGYKTKRKKTIKTDPETRIAHEKSVVPRVQQSPCITNAILVQPKY